MKPKGRHVLVKAEPREKVLKSGIIIPDTATPKEQEFGVVVDGNGHFDAGTRVLFVSAKCPERDGLKLVDKTKVILWNL